jgi:DNA-binding NtrC family response regulator
VSENTKLLLIDDEEDIRDVLTLILESNFDYEVVQASSGNEAIELLKTTEGIGLVFCDYRMPDGNGGVVYSYMKDNLSHLPYVMVSTDGPEDYSVFLSFKEDNPLNNCIKKPFGPDTVVDMVTNTFQKSF